MEHVTGPDFPTGGIVCGRAGIHSAYKTGRGKVVVRAKYHTETMANGKERIIVTEIPYQVNKANLLEKIAGLVRDKRIDGITDLRDESDRNGMRMVIELRRDVMAEVVLNHLYKYTQLQDTFSIYNLALVKKQPQLLNLKDLITHYINHRHEIVVRRTQFELRKAKDRAHILEGLRIAQEHIDEVIALIKKSTDQSTAKEALEKAFDLSDKQSAAIVSMRLGQLSALDVNKIENEYQELLITIADLEDILANKERRMQMIVDRLDEVEQKFGDARRTKIEEAIDDIDIEDLIADEPMVISLSNEGYVKRMSVDTYRSQGRGGVGLSGGKLKEEDFVKTLFIANTHAYLLVFTNQGRAHWMKVYHIPEASRAARGKAIVNMIQFAEGEKVSAIVPIPKFEEGHYIMLATRAGTINKMDVNLFSKPRRGGVNAISLDDGDELVSAILSDHKFNVLLASKKGQAICFPPSSFRAMGRGTRGVRGIRLASADSVIGMILLSEGTKVLTITENGYGKRTKNDEYRITNRGGKGIRNVNITDKTGEAVSVLAAEEENDIIVTTKNGTVMRTSIVSVPVYGRSSQGVKVIKLREGDEVMDIAYLEAKADELALDSEAIESEPATTENLTEPPAEDV
jgi:DNA gyrase subunit A